MFNWPWAEINHRFWTNYDMVPRQLESDVSTIYNYIDSLGNKIATPNLIDNVGLCSFIKWYSKNISQVFELTQQPKYWYLVIPMTLKIHPLIKNDI